MISDADFSHCQRYRYRLRRLWGDGKPVAFIMLNPSTADAVNDDPTVSRCIERAKRLGYDGLIVVNVFAWRATDPRELDALPDPFGPHNASSILWAARDAAKVICAWGSDKALRKPQPFTGVTYRDYVLRLLAMSGTKPHHLKMNADGNPAHPLYLPYSLQPKPMVTP